MLMVRKAAVCACWVIALLVIGAEVLSFIRFALIFFRSGLRGVIGELGHIALLGQNFPVSPAESHRLLWRSTGEIALVHVGGLLLIWVAWKLQRSLRKAQ